VLSDVCFRFLCCFLHALREIGGVFNGGCGEDSLHFGRIQRIYSLAEGFGEHYQRLAKEVGQQARS